MTLSRSIAELITKKGIQVEDVEKTLRTYKLLSLLPSIKKEIEQLTRAEQGTNAITIESPFPLDESAIARIKRIVGNDLAPHEIVINKDILAGFKARYKGKLYDGSAERIVKKFTHSTNN